MFVNINYVVPSTFRCPSVYSHVTFNEGHPAYQSFTFHMLSVTRLMSLAYLMRFELTKNILKTSDQDFIPLLSQILRLCYLLGFKILYIYIQHIITVCSVVSIIYVLLQMLYIYYITICTKYVHQLYILRMCTC